MNKALELAYYDVVVCGGGPAGFGAAISAARHGQKTLLLELNGATGGTATSGALPFWLGHTNGSIPFPQMMEKGLAYKDCPHPRKAVGGIFEEAMNRIKAANGGVGPAIMGQTDKYPGLDRLGCHDEFTFDLEIGKRVMDEMLVEAGVDIRYYAHAMDVEREGNTVKGVYFVDKSGLQYVPAGVVIDCTGDADMIAAAGFETYKGDKVTGEMTGVGLVVHLENIDAAAMEKYLNEGGDPWFRPQLAQARADHPGMDLPEGGLIICPMVQDGVFMVNGGTSHYGYDGTSGQSMTDLTLRGRQRARILAEVVFPGYIPGGKNAKLRISATYPGVRETRRIISERALTEDDLLNGTRFPDTIALAGRHFDLCRKGTGKNGNDGRQEFAEAGKKVLRGITEIPFSCMIPKGADNILAAGRCVEAEGQALGPARIMSTCMAMGEAAGTAAAHKLAAGCPFGKLDVAALRQDLRDHGCEVDG